MSINLSELRHKRSNLIVQARKLVDAADKENRAMTSEENANYEKYLADATTLKDQIENKVRIQDLDREIEEGKEPEPIRSGGIDPSNGDEPKKIHPLARKEYKEAFLAWITGGGASLSPIHQKSIGQVYAALQMDLDVSGGYLVTPIEIITKLLMGVDDMVFIRQRATKFQVSMAAGFGVPTLDADPADADWTSELGTGNEDSTMAFGQRELHPHPVAKRIKISNKLLRASFLDVENLVRQRLEYKFAVTHEKAFLTGNGSNQPLGVFTANANGIPTTRDYSTGNTTTSITFDGLVGAKYNMKGQYWPRMEWLFHRDALSQIAKLKDGNGNFIWRESPRVGEPDLLLGRPFMMSEFAPNTFTAGLYVGILGDFSFYWIVDALNMTIQRLIELYAETSQVGLIGRMESDGMPVLSEAWTRVTLAT